MNAFVAITDYEWFKLLASQPEIDEVNFWQPGGTRVFSTIEKNELFLFKLHSPRNFIVGGGIFAHSNLLPVSMAWDAFKIKNGVSSLLEMRKRIEQYRRQIPNPKEDYTIGCILLSQPFFFPEKYWIPIPSDWKTGIQQGKRYNLENGLGAALYKEIQGRLAHQAISAISTGTEEHARYGTPVTVLPRLGQGSFRLVITDIYERKCAISGERVLPVLVAAHIRPYSLGGTHSLNNGILLRSDFHTLLDKGYITISIDHRLEVSRRIHDHFNNGKEYYAYHGESVYTPNDRQIMPAHENIVWHNDNVFLS
jgi:putative restriction endonuclease